MLIFSIVAMFLVALYGGLIVYYHRAWDSMPLYVPAVGSDMSGVGGDIAGNVGGRAAGVRITVLVPARNEEMNIGDCLASLAGQTYPREWWEVIVIDDHSTDGMAGIVKGMEGVRYLSLAERNDGSELRAHKKRAIEAGVQEASGELIVTTDADCVFHPEWLKTIAAFYKEERGQADCGAGTDRSRDGPTLKGHGESPYEGASSGPAIEKASASSNDLSDIGFYCFARDNGGGGFEAGDVDV